MNLGIELVCERALSVDDTTYFQTAIEVDGTTVPGSTGKDVYLTNGMILPGRRVAATGRSAEYGLSSAEKGIGLGAIEALPSNLVTLSARAEERVVFSISNNAVLDPGIFCMEFSLTVRVHNGAARTLDISLRRPDVRMDWPLRGTFKFDITDAIREYCKPNLQD